MINRVANSVMNFSRSTAAVTRTPIKCFFGDKTHAKTTNCFAIFNIPARFHLDLPALDSSFKKLQKQLHPDLNHNASGSTPPGDCPLDSSAVNHAYQILRNPADRARHLLHVVGVDEAGTEEIVNDPNVCLEAFELRESIEEIKAKGDIADAVELEKDVREKINREGHTIEKFMKDSEVENMKLSAARLIYLSKALDEITAIDEDFEHMP